MNVGSFFITVTKSLNNPNFAIVDQCQLPVSWGSSTVMIHQRKQLDEESLSSFVASADGDAELEAEEGAEADGKGLRMTTAGMRGMGGGVMMGKMKILHEEPTLLL